MCFDRFHVFYLLRCWVSPKDCKGIYELLHFCKPRCLIFSLPWTHFPQSQQCRDLLWSKAYRFVCFITTVLLSQKNVFCSFVVFFFFVQKSWIGSLSWYKNCCLLYCTEAPVPYAVQLHILQKDGELVAEKSQPYCWELAIINNETYTSYIRVNIHFPHHPHENSGIFIPEVHSLPLNRRSWGFLVYLRLVALWKCRSAAYITQKINFFKWEIAQTVILFLQ